MKKEIWIPVLTVLASGLVAFLVSFTTTRCTSSNNTSETETISSPTTSTNLSLGTYPDFSYVAEKAVEAVVYVEVTEIETYQPEPKSIFDYFFGSKPAPQTRELVGHGSGVIISPDGYIITNNHVIEGASKIVVTMNDEKKYSAVLIGTDPASDVAVIKIQASNLPTLEFADSEKLHLGEWVLAIGSPYELRSTITAGIVSAKGRSWLDTSGEFKIESFIQTDAAVNPGNSGGALVDMKGNLVGINTLIYTETGSFSGYSFAIPSNIVRKVSEDIINHGSVQRVVFGITMKNIDQKIADELKLSSVSGVYIVEVSEGKAADRAGLKPGDVILQVDSTLITGAPILQEAINKYRPGSSARIKAVRDGEQMEFEINF